MFTMPRFVLVFVVVICAITGSSSEEAPLLPILEVLDRSRLSGSLEFVGRCVEGYTPDFPQFRPWEARAGTPLQSIREMLPNNETFQVTIEKGGIVRMIEPDVPTDILNVKISHITLEGSATNGKGAVYDPNDALIAILRTPEVVAFMEAHQIEWPFHGGGLPGNFIGKWTGDQPHISGSMDNVTVSEALDRILQTFPGVWVYENCPQSKSRKRDVYLGFFYLQKMGPKNFASQ
jgi:hypothetical protein